MSDLQIILTEDGSHSLLNTVLNETYHSIHGAVQESLHVFIKNGLAFFCGRSSIEPIGIFEVGFGTGLNALLVAQYAEKNNRSIHYTTLEAFPLPEEIWSQLNYSDSPEARKLFQEIHQAAWSEEKSLSKHFTLTKIHDTLQHVPLSSDAYNLIFFDAFAPNKQPELWNIEVLGKVASAMTSNSVFVTYCAKGQLKRDLKSLQLTVNTLAGPPGKKEMVQALKI
jgi:tRNA U34 5-methylaminomethyl-2-thiouridine-forming methyltransferase MnmC